MEVPESHSENFVGLALAGASAFATYYFLKFILDGVRNKNSTKTVLKDFPEDSEKYPVTLVTREKLLDNIIKLSFTFTNKEDSRAIETGQHVQLFSETTTRSYTPIETTLERDDNNKTGFTIVLKVYQPTETEVNRGAMSRALDGLAVGDKITARTRTGPTLYCGHGLWRLRRRGEVRTCTVKKIGLVAGGTGITPMLQIINSVLNNPLDPTELSLVFANHSDNDVFLKKELDKLVERDADRLRVYYTISKCSPEMEKSWKYSIGRIDVPMLRDHLPAPSPDVITFVCGPRSFTKDITSCLGRVGHDVDTAVVQL